MFSKLVLMISHFVIDFLQTTETFEIEFFLLFLSLVFLVNFNFGRICFFQIFLHFIFLLFVVFPLDSPKQMSLSFFKQGVLESVFLVFLSGLMKIVHVQLDNRSFTCLTKEVQLECLKCVGKTVQANSFTFLTTKPSPFLVQQIMSLYFSFCIRGSVLRESRRF